MIPILVINTIYECIGWIQYMLWHGSLQMIFIKYYAWIPRKTRNDGSVFIECLWFGEMGYG